MYVEVYAPPREPGKHYPVLVNIPGGVFVGGTGGAPYLDGEQAVRQSGVIEVAITYRVGPLGFLASPALNAENPFKISGNYGIEDQTLALRWVHDNIIAAFGGDPDRVTIIGD